MSPHSHHHQRKASCSATRCMTIYPLESLVRRVLLSSPRRLPTFTLSVLTPPHSMRSLFLNQNRTVRYGIYLILFC
jgi:hypothetical protein